MSIIQRIREKYATVVIVIIAISLISFILMDAFVGRSKGIFSKNSNTIAKINDQKISADYFSEKINLQEQQYEMAGMKMDDATRQQIMQSLWGQLINESIINTECEKLGIQVSSKELSDVLFGNTPPQFMLQLFTDKNTGIYDVERARQEFAKLKKRSNDPQAQLFMKVYIEPLIQELLQEKYFSFFGQGAYLPKWFITKQMTDDGFLASASIVQIPYSTISDAAIQIADDEIKKYIQDNKEQYKQEEPLRNIAYVLFSFAPISADTAEVLNQLNTNKEEFKTTKNTQDFLNRVGTELAFYDGYLKKEQLTIPSKYKDSLSNDKFFGPYIDAKNYVMARVLDSKTIPDSVKCRHILVSTQQNPQTGQVALEDSVAKKRADSIALAIKQGANFDTMVKKYSDDEGSKNNGGVYGYFSQGKMTKEFNNFCFESKIGDKKVVKTEFGYHYIEIMDQKNMGTGYKIAYLAKPIEASQITINNANNAAAQFAGESPNSQAFNETIKKKNLLKSLAQDIRENDYTIQNIGTNRQLIKWIYEHKVGDVSEPFSVNDKFVVATIEQINDGDLISINRARPTVEPILRNRKKADQIISKIQKNANIEAVATQFGKQVVKVDSISFSSTIVPNMGIEPKVIGAAFNKEWQQKSSLPIAGNSGVFIIRSEQISAKAVMNVGVPREQLKSNNMYRSAEALRKAATIKDYRANFY